MAGELQTATMTARRAAQYLGISYWKLLELAKAGKVPHVRVGGKLLFRKASLETWLEGCEQASLRRETEPAGKIRRLK